MSESINSVPCPRLPSALARLVPIGVALSCLALSGALRAESDDFNDGDDAGWTHFDPRGGIGLGPQAFFTFPGGNSYRIQTPVSVPANAAGPGRAGATFGPAYSNFYISVDLINWDDNTHQAFGLLARVNTPGLQSLGGYSFTYERGSGVTPTSGDMDISVIVNEDPDSIEAEASNYHLDPTKDYRFVFTGRGSQLEGRLYELPDVETPVITLTANDGTYASGTAGLVTFDASGGTGVTDATFDNFIVQAGPSPELSVTLNLLGEAEVRWATDLVGLRLQATSDLTQPIVWEDIPVNQIFDEPPNGKSYFEGASPGVRVFRLIQD